MKFDVVLQGPIPPYIQDVVDTYTAEPWVNHVIISTWDGEPGEVDATEQIGIVLSQDILQPGVGNRNRQIVSTRAGLSQVETSYVIKARTDQIIQDLPMMYEFFKVRHGGKQIFTCGLYRDYPFHPRDHFFMGRVQDIHALFDLPLDPYDGPVDYTQCMRAETWLGAHYYAKHDRRVAAMLRSPELFLTDNAPLHDEAMRVDFALRPRLFDVFPRIRMAWPKHGLSAYHYDVGARYSEYWHEGD